MSSYKANINVRVNNGSITNSKVYLKEQKGAVIKGKVLFEDNIPAYNATVVLSYKDPINQEIIPVTFTFTDIDGVFIFCIKNINLDYIVDVSYNEELYF